MSDVVGGAGVSVPVGVDSVRVGDCGRNSVETLDLIAMIKPMVASQRFMSQFTAHLACGLCAATLCRAGVIAPTR